MSSQPVQWSDRRPLGVYVLAIVQFGRAALLIAQLLGDSVLPDARVPRISFQIPQQPPGTLESLISPALGIGIIVTSIAIGVGLLAGRRWAWVGAIAISGVSLAVAIGAWWADDPAYLAMLLNVVAVFYLNQRDVRAAFGELQPADRLADD
jgi:hypothetical protein